jgi:hypothetical protein
MKYTSIFALTLFAVASALAQNNISWVASTGSNSNACTRTAPCLSFQTALANTNPGGIIKAVDAANYGTVSVSQAITIDGNGARAEIEVGASGATGIFISAGPVNIRDLTIHVVPGGNGIFTSADTHIENVVIAGTPVYGVWADGTRLTTKNLTVTGATQNGVFITASASAGSSASIRDSVFRGFFFGGTGIYVQAISGFATVALIERSELSFNSTGLIADNSVSGGGATVRISDCVITGNTTGISAINGGQIISFRTNMLAGNSIDGATPFSISLK